MGQMAPKTDRHNVGTYFCCCIAWCWIYFPNDVAYVLANYGYFSAVLLGFFFSLLSSSRGGGGGVVVMVVVVAVVNVCMKKLDALI
jgi:hypothetical protein